MSIVVNSKLLPSVSVAAVWGELTVEDIDVMRRHYRELHKVGKRFLIYVDARRSKVPSSSVRRALADMSNEFIDVAKKNSIRVVVTLDSKLLVGVLTAIRWFLKTDVEVEWFSSATACRPRIEELLRAENLTPPDGLLAMLKKLDGAKEEDLHAFSD